MKIDETERHCAHWEVFEPLQQPLQQRVDFLSRREIVSRDLISVKWKFENSNQRDAREFVCVAW